MGLISRFWKAIATGYKLFLASAEIMRITYVTDTTSVIGSNIANDNLIMKANSSDTSPVIELIGDADIVLKTKTGVVFAASGANIGFQTGDATDYKFLTYVNRNIFFDPHGTGKLKFGTYTGGSATDSTGYITILDAAGNTRKLMVQA